MAVNYVKFFRGTPLAFENVIKNKDTLYFITETDSNKGSLYLGEKLISSNIADIAGLEDILLSELDNGHLLTYDESSQKWINKSIIDAIGLMIGAKENAQGGAGLVPAPGINQQDLFLRGDGTWAAPNSISELSVDNKTIETAADGYTISLKSFGKQYYKYVEDHYELQIVDTEHPWMEGLEPKVVAENGELVIGWFEPNIETIEGVQNQIAILQSNVGNLEEELNDKANAIDVYTKEEIDVKISEAIVATNHLKRQTFKSLAEAKEFAAREDINPEQYLFMILDDETSENNKYLEYLWINNDLEWIGSYEADLTEYVKSEELINYVKIGDLNNYLKKEELPFESVSSDFTITQAKVLTLDILSPTKIEGLSDLMTNFNSVQTKVVELSNKQTILEAKVGSLEELTKDLDSKFISTNDFNKIIGDLDFMKENDINLLDKVNNLEAALTWQDIN